MSESLTLNKITSQKGITIAEAASRVADLGNLGSPFDGDGRSACAGRGAAHRVYHADGRRTPALDDSDEPEEMVHGKLYRPRRVRYYRSCVRQMLRHHDRPSVRR